MFSTKAIAKKIRPENAYIVYSQFYNLPEKRVLFLTQDKNDKNTTLKIFSSDDLNTCFVERTLADRYNFLCTFPDGTILLETYTELIKISPDTLNTLSVQPWNSSFRAGVINNESFFIIKQDNEGSKNSRHFLIMYAWNKNTYVECSKIPFSISPNAWGGSGYMSHILFLGNNRYCCHLQGHNTADFRVLVFEINPEKNELKEIGVIQPKAQHHGSGSAASGSMTALPNGQLVTYHEHHDNVQIWDTETLTCVKEWNWADATTKKPADFQGCFIEINPFPDSLHLLVKQSDRLYIFDTDKFVMKKIDLTKDLAKKSRFDQFGNHHILPNGQIFAFMDCGYDNGVQILHFDTKVMMNYQASNREKMNTYLLLRFSFIVNQGIPKEVTDNILLRAYTLGIGESAKNASDDFIKKESSDRNNCVLF